MEVSDDGVPETEVVSIDLKPVGEGDVIHVQHVLIEEEPNYGVKAIWGWIKSIWTLMI